MCATVLNCLSVGIDSQEIPSGRWVQASLEDPAGFQSWLTALPFQDRGWRMFTAWIDKCTAEFGISSVGDVRQKNPKHTDNMVSNVDSYVIACFVEGQVSQESFVFAETFKVSGSEIDVVCD